MQKWAGFLAGLAVGLSLPALASQDAALAPSALLGFSARSVAAQLDVEKRFDSGLDAGELRAWLERLAAGPNHVGAPHNKENAEFVLQQLRSWGWQAEIEVFHVLYPTPRSHTLELIAPTEFKASLHEPAVDGDSTSSSEGVLPPYTAYGADGDVTGELVYVNYGMDEDYKELARRGIDVKGKIVIARYGAGWRGLKPKLAYQHGAIGCLIYSDPQGDGYSEGDTYPKGGWRPKDGVQRGSVLDMPVYPGDPLTPGVGATKNVKRLSIAEAKTILKIPVMPISYADAQPLLAALEGPVASPGWRGSLPLTYHLGPGPAKVHMAIVSDWSLKPLYNVIARIPGSEAPDEWVIRGNHRDAWTFGAWDPLSGTVSLMAEAKSIGALLKSGWKPKRTLIYASWDGEEPALLGSTEWAEQHAEELKRKAVLYLNSDTNARGFLSAGGSHSLQRFVNQLGASVRDPQTGVSVQERLRAQMRVAGLDKGAGDAEKKKAAKAAEGGDLPIEALGSGSDFTPFLQHLGLASLDVSYAGEEQQEGVYHSLYDSFDHYVRFGDPGLAYGIAEAQTVGRAMLRMTGAEVLPFEFRSFASTVEGYLEELHTLVDARRKDAEELGKLLDSGAYVLAADPTRRLLPPERQPAAPFLDFAPLDNAVARLRRSAQAYDDSQARLAAQGTQLSVTQRKALNDLLRGMEQALTNPRGLPGREWFKHFVYAPGLLTGYGVKTLPGVREAIEEHRWDEANEYLSLTASVLTAYCDRLDAATALSAAAGSDRPAAPRKAT